MAEKRQTHSTGKGGAEVDYVVAFAANADGPSGVSKPFEILRVGEYQRGTRSVPVTSEDLDTALANFNRWKSMGQEIPVDYDHAFSEGREAPAAGWYVSMERREDSLYATVRWTDKARDEIKSQQYRFFSPEFAKEFVSETGEQEGFTILAGALTNRPFLRGMTPVALNQEVNTAMATWAVEKMEEIEAGEPGGVADTSPGVADPTKAEKFTVEIDGEEKEFTAEEIVAMSKRADEAEEAKTKAEKDAEAAKAEAGAKDSTIESLTKRVDTMETSAKDREFTEIFSQAQRDGRVDAKDETKETWRETFDALGVEKTRNLLNQVPAETIPMTAEGRGTGGDQSTIPAGQHPESFKINQRVESYMREHPDVEFDRALEIVRGEMVEAGS